MAQTKLTAGNATNAFGIMRGGNDGSLVIVVGANGAQRNAASFSTNGDVRPWYNNTPTVSTTSSYTFDPANGQVQLITVTGNITITFGAPTNIVEGTMYQMLLKAGDTSSRLFSWNAAYKFPSATSVLLSGTSTTGGIDIISFIGGASNTLIFTGVLQDVR